MKTHKFVFLCVDCRGDAYWKWILQCDPQLEISMFVGFQIFGYKFVINVKDK